jgi:hypothetical protein
MGVAKYSFEGIKTEKNPFTPFFEGSPGLLVLSSSLGKNLCLNSASLDSISSSERIFLNSSIFRMSCWIFFCFYPSQVFAARHIHF